MKKTILTAAVTICAMGVLFAGISLIIIYSGAYSVAATSPHSKLVEGLIGTALDESVEAHAKGLKAPASALAAKGRAGFMNYEMLCVKCHGAPGVETPEIGKGMYPPAPELAKAADDLSMEEVYWIMANGIKDTGMPAFRRGHDEEDLWMVASFVKRLNKISAKDYESLRQGGGG